MSGTIIRVLPKTDYEYTSLGASASPGISTIARRIDTSKFREAILLVRLHASTSWANGATVFCYWSLDSYTEEDPGATWANSPANTNLLSFVQGADAPPAAKSAAIVSPFGPLISIQLKFTQGTVGSIAFKPTISIDLNLKGD